MRLRTYLLIIFFIGIALFARGLPNEFVGDDELQILQNTKVHSIANLPAFFSGSTYETAGGTAITGIFYRPVMMTIFSLLYSIGGPNPLLFHFTQVLLHILVTMCLFFFLCEFFPDIGAFLLSLIILVHPANSEAVLYSANLQEVLFLLFGMLALLLVQKNAPYSVSLRKEKTSWHIWCIPMLLLLSLFSKESGILFLVIVPLYGLIFDKKRFRFLLTGSAITFGVYLFFRYVIAHMYGANTSLAPIANLHVLQRLMHIPIIILYYVMLFFYPVELLVFQYWTISTISLGNFWLPLFIDIGFFTLLIVGYMWTAKQYPAHKKIYLFFALWFVIGLGFHLQILPLDVTVADRWFYFPIVGLLGLLGVVASQLQLAKRTKIQVVGIGTISILLLLLSLRTYTRIADWHNDLTLFGHDSSTQSNYILDNSYGAALIQDGQFEKAKKYVITSMRKHPYTANINNMAIIFVSEGNISKAKEYFQKAIGTGQTYSLYENYANFLLYYDSPNSALEFSQKALIIYPQSPKLLLIFGEAEYIQGDKDKALRAVARSYEILPDGKTLNIFTTMQQRKPLSLKHN